MGSIDDFPKRPQSHEIAEESEIAFRHAIDAAKRFHVQVRDRSDYGTDLQIEALDGEAVTNLRCHAQLKGTNTEANADGSVSISVSRSTLNYLLSQPHSILVCFHKPTGR